MMIMHDDDNDANDVLVCSSLLVLYQPAAAGSGIPEIIGFLNGTRIKDIFKLQTLIVKFLSCAFAVG